MTRPSWADAWERAGTPPEAPKVAPRPAQAVGRGSCKAVDAKTGRQCRRLEHPEDPKRHRHERGEFQLELQPGAVPLLHQQLDEASTARPNSEVYKGASHVAGENTPTISKRGSQGGALKESIARNRKSAHAGDVTTTGLESIDRRSA